MRRSRRLAVGGALMGVLALGGCTNPVHTTTAPSTGPPATASAAAPTATSTSMTATASPVPSPVPSPTPRPSPTAAPASGVQGFVTAGPTCPVERIGSPCPPRPVSAEVDARDAASGRLVGATHSGADGSYQIPLTPGSYTLTILTTGQFPRCPSQSVVVTGGQVTQRDISCDTGIR